MMPGGFVRSPLPAKLWCSSAELKLPVAVNNCS